MWSSRPNSQGHFSGKGCREQQITRQPEAAKRITVAWPMPREAPVSTNVLRFCLPLVGMASIVQQGTWCGFARTAGRGQGRVREALKG